MIHLMFTFFNQEQRNMGEKQKLIAEMLEMQRKFIEYDRKHGMNQEDYWVENEDHPLNNYRENYAALASKVVDLAHTDKGSKR